MCIQVQYAKKNREGAVEYFKVLARTVMEDKEKSTGNRVQMESVLAVIGSLKSIY